MPPETTMTNTSYYIFSCLDIGIIVITNEGQLSDSAEPVSGEPEEAEEESA